MKFKEEQISLLCKHLKGYISPQDVILLIGELGGGKTTFTRYFLREYGYEGPVRSPTYTIVTLYPTNPPIIHADLYRLKTNEETEIEDHLYHDLCIIEWPERALTLFDNLKTWKIYFEIFDEITRIITVQPPQDVLYSEFSLKNLNF